MLAEVVALHDVKDAEGFVQATINRARLVLSPDEREELAAEGLAILCKLAGDWQPRREGYQQDGRFSGYAAMYLPRKLGDAWHRMHPEHLLRTQPDGGRRWQYGDRAVSLNAMTAEDGEDREQLLAGRDADETPAPTVERLLRGQLEERFDVALRVSGLMAEGLTSDREIAEVLGLTTSQVRDARADLEPVAQRLRTLSQR